jgi:hypothetical protein
MMMKKENKRRGGGGSGEEKNEMKIKSRGMKISFVCKSTPHPFILL